MRIILFFLQQNEQSSNVDMFSHDHIVSTSSMTQSENAQSAEIDGKTQPKKSDVVTPAPTKIKWHIPTPTQVEKIKHSLSLAKASMASVEADTSHSTYNSGSSNAVSSSPVTAVHADDAATVVSSTTASLTSPNTGTCFL